LDTIAEKHKKIRDAKIMTCLMDHIRDKDLPRLLTRPWRRCGL